MNDPLKAYRHRLRAKMNTRRLMRELALYNDLFASRQLIIPDEPAIRLAVQRKFPGLQPKAKGSLNILAIYHHYAWENDSLKPALEKFGTVRHYDWMDHFDHRRKDWHRRLKADMNRDLVENVRRGVEEDRTDVIFTYLSGEIVSPECAASLAALSIPIINLALNDKEHFVGKIRGGQAIGARDICRYFTLCWTSTEDALKKYCVEGAVPLYLPEGANPEIHKPHALEKSIDVSFVGQCYGNRPEIITGLRQQGIQVETYGEGWPNGPLATEDMIKLYSRSRINLGFGGVAGHPETYCLKGRDFEIPMSGGLYLTEYHRELELVYDIGQEIMVYKDFDDLLGEIRDLLANPKQADEIRQRGFLRAGKDHAWEMRFDKVFSLIGLIGPS